MKLLSFELFEIAPVVHDFNALLNKTSGDDEVDEQAYAFELDEPFASVFEFLFILIRLLRYFRVDEELVLVLDLFISLSMLASIRFDFLNFRPKMNPKA